MLSLFSQNEMNPAKTQDELAEPVAVPLTDQPAVIPVQKNLKDEDIKLETISRLRKVLGTLQQSQLSEEAAVEPAHSEVPPELANGRVPSPAGAWQNIIPTPKTAQFDRVAATGAGRPAPGAGASGEIQQLAEQFTSKLLGAVTGVFQDMRGLLAEDRAQVIALREHVEMQARLLTDIQSSLQNLSQRHEALEARVGKVDANLAEIREGLVKLGERAEAQEQARSALEKRLEAQASAIRAIHAGIQEREDRFNKLLLTLQAPAAAPPSPGLPDNL